MPKPFLTARPALSYLEPDFSRALHALVRGLSRPYLHFALGIRNIRVEGMEELVEQYSSFSRGRSRLILAFRHSHVNDGPVLFHLLTNLLPRSAKKSGIGLPEPVHAHY